MATAADKYEGVNPLDKLHPGEPYFFIRAQDVISPGGIEGYANSLNIAAAVVRYEADQYSPSQPEFDRLDLRADQLHKQALRAFEFAEVVRLWQRDNPELVKLPD